MILKREFRGALRFKNFASKAFLTIRRIRPESWQTARLFANTEESKHMLVGSSLGGIECPLPLKLLIIDTLSDGSMVAAACVTWHLHMRADKPRGLLSRNLVDLSP